MREREVGWENGGGKEGVKENVCGERVWGERKCGMRDREREWGE